MRSTLARVVCPSIRPTMAMALDAEGFRIGLAQFRDVGRHLALAQGLKADVQFLQVGENGERKGRYQGWLRSHKQEAC